MSSLITEYPLWFIIFCFAAGFLFAWLLYRKDKKFAEASKLIRNFMFALRFLSVSIISFLLLSPVLKSLGKIIEQPIIVYAQDNSESVNSDKGNIKMFSKNISNFFNEKQNNYIFKTYTFGEKIKQTDSFSFSEKQTDIAELISDIKNKYYHRNIGAVILASDGIYNKGTNPAYEINDINFPIYTIALGDTSIKEDLILTKVKNNKIAFLKNTYPLQISVKAKKLKGKQSEIQIFDNGKLIKIQKFTINNNDFFKNYNFEIKADKLGFHKLKIKLKELEEVNFKNNSKQVITEVVDSKQKILILANSPHPDISAIRQALELNQNFETDFFLANKFNKPVYAYNLIILHQLPSKYNSGTAVISQIKQSNIPVLYILGSQSSLQKFDNLNTGLTTGAYANSADEVKGKLNQNFTLFEVNPDIETISLNAPPMLSAFGNYKTSGDAQILFSRKVRNIDTGFPLIVFNSATGGKKTAVITGEGIWRWRIFDYKSNQNHYLFNELINKIVQYLTQKETKERFKIIAEKIIPENQEIVIKAEVYDKNFELVNAGDVNIQISDSAKQIKDYIFEKSGKSYKIDIGKLPSGDYSWKAETIIKGKRYKKEGIFSVVPLNIEAENTIADHNILYKISENTGGKLFYPKEISKLLESVQKNENIVPVAYSEKKTESLINFKIIFFLLTALLTGEWFMRKFRGAY
ncbi:MAG: hypothetical protein L3J35_11130 [Bacteroidales bacterium]|nr:hypothetical protein [Bacteroidales bacterium]